MPKAPTNPSTETEEKHDTRVATIETLVTGVKAKGFTFGAGQTVHRVAILHAEHLEKKGEARIIDILPA